MSGPAAVDSTMTFLPFEIGYLTDDIVEKAERELGETDEVRRAALVEFRKMVKEERKLFCSMEDVYFLQFLRARKYNVKRAYSLFSNYYHIKKSHPEVYYHDFSGFRKSYENHFISIMPFRDPDGCPIVIFKLENWDFDTRKFCSVVQDLTVTILLCVEDLATHVTGIKFIVDVKTLCLNHIRHVHPKYLHLIAKGMKNCLPARFKGVHIVNESSLFQYFWNVLRLVMTEKLKNRMHFHSTNMASLHKHFPPEVLPVEYGGKVVYDDRWVLKKLDSVRSVYDAKMSYGYRSRKSSREGTVDS